MAVFHGLREDKPAIEVHEEKRAFVKRNSEENQENISNTIGDFKPHKNSLPQRENHEATSRSVLPRFCGFHPSVTSPIVPSIFCVVLKVLLNNVFFKNILPEKFSGDDAGLNRRKKWDKNIYYCGFQRGTF